MTTTQRAPAAAISEPIPSFRCGGGRRRFSVRAAARGAAPDGLDLSPLTHRPRPLWRESAAGSKWERERPRGPEPMMAKAYRTTSLEPGITLIDSSRGSSSLARVVPVRADAARLTSSRGRGSDVHRPPTSAKLNQATGSVTRTVVPRPGSLSMRSWPPWANTRCLTIASPRPVPPSSRDRALSTR